MHSASLYFLSVYILFQLNSIIFVSTCRDFFLFLFNPSDCEVAAEIFIIVVNIIYQSLNGWWIFLYGVVRETIPPTDKKLFLGRSRKVSLFAPMIIT